MQPSYEFFNIPGRKRRVIFFTAADSEAGGECRRLCVLYSLSLATLALGSSAGAEAQTLDLLKKGVNATGRVDQQSAPRQ